MTKQKTVTVYSFSIIESTPESSVVSSFKASRDLIWQKFNGQVLEGTGEEVPVAELDAQGRYRRIATGWGELPER